jgi:hypothetical protein
MTSRKIVLDLETLSTESSAAIVQIAAMDLASGEVFNVYIDPRSSERAGLHVSVETIEWWDKQDPQIRDVVMSGTETIQAALSDFLNWCDRLSGGNIESIELWAWGVDFDIPILRNAIETFTAYPFDFRKHRCLRSLAAALEIGHKKADRAHDALEDVKAQAVTLALCLKALY